MIEPQKVRELLVAGLSDADVEVKDLTGTKDHYEARIASSAFSGKSLIEQHKLVYAALGSAMDGPIHALALKTYTPDQWAKMQSQA
jgi:stress-induced morphogen